MNRHEWMIGAVITLLFATALAAVGAFAWHEYAHPCVRTEQRQETCTRGGDCRLWIDAGNGRIGFYQNGRSICARRDPTEHYPCTVTRCVERKP